MVKTVQKSAYQKGLICQNKPIEKGQNRAVNANQKGLYGQNRLVKMDHKVHIICSDQKSLQENG